MLKIQKVFDRMTPSLEQKIAELQNRLPRETYDEWVSNTPRKTGNARRSTTLSGNTIKANYGYAVPLDQGRSRQAPRGMDKPTFEWLKRRVRQLLGAK